MVCKNDNFNIIDILLIYLLYFFDSITMYILIIC